MTVIPRDVTENFLNVKNHESFKTILTANTRKLLQEVTQNMFCQQIHSFPWEDEYSGPIIMRQKIVITQKIKIIYTISVSKKKNLDYRI